MFVCVCVCVCVCMCVHPYVCALCLYVYDYLGLNLSEFMVHTKSWFMCVSVCVTVNNWILPRLDSSKVNIT